MDHLSLDVLSAGLGVKVTLGLGTVEISWYYLIILNFIIEVKNSNKTSCVIFSIILGAWRVIMKLRNLGNYIKTTRWKSI